MLRTLSPPRRRRAALALYAATIISARVGTPTLLWIAANLAFTLPAALKAGALPKVCTAACHCSFTLGQTLGLDPRNSVLRASAGGPRCREQCGGSDGATEGGRARGDAAGAPALRQGPRLAAAGGHSQSSDHRRKVRRRRALLPLPLCCTPSFTLCRPRPAFPTPSMPSPLPAQLALVLLSLVDAQGLGGGLRLPPPQGAGSHLLDHRDAGTAHMPRHVQCRPRRRRSSSTTHFPSSLATIPARVMSGGRGGRPDQEEGQDARTPHVDGGAPAERAAQGRVSSKRAGFAGVLCCGSTRERAVAPRLFRQQKQHIFLIDAC